MAGGLMGIDRHELEHRNWHSAAAKPLERDADITPLDVTIVPDNVEAFTPKPKKSAGQKSGNKVKTNA